MTEKLKIVAGWDWAMNFFTGGQLGPIDPAEQAALDNNQLSIVMREDGDDNAAIVAAVKGVDAPDEHTRLETIDPLVADVFLAIAWDDRVIDLTIEEDDS